MVYIKYKHIYQNDTKCSSKFIKYFYIVFQQLFYPNLLDIALSLTEQVDVPGKPHHNFLDLGL